MGTAYFCRTDGCEWSGELPVHRIAVKDGKHKICGLCTQPATEEKVDDKPQPQVRRDINVVDQNRMAQQSRREWERSTNEDALKEQIREDREIDQYEE